MKRTALTTSGPRSFDPERLGAYECQAWVGYYLRDWRAVLLAAVGMIREGFGMSWPRTLAGAWWVLRANQKWAPYPHNDPDAARRCMLRFYTHVIRAHGLAIATETAATLEVAWWHEHRVLQRERSAADETALVSALAALYSYVYGVPIDAVRPAARDRALAMRVSDAWVAAGCAMGDPRLREELQLLVSSYSLLREAVQP